MTPVPAHAPASDPKPAFLNPDVPLVERVDDLLKRMTLEEKVSQMSNRAAAIPRLGIPAYNFWNEALHGVARNGRATVFPEPIGMAATWDPVLVQKVASATGDEARAKYHAALQRNGETGWYQGLTFWSPNVNLFRDPRWGRGQETWGEDPFLSGEMGAAFVRGLQGDHPRYLKAAACAKHYAVHSGPESLRHTFNAVVSRRELYDSYLPAFKKLVTEARVEAVMGAYNRTLGEPCCASRLLLDEVLRGEWGFEGHVVSDCGALSDFHRNHHVTADAAESAALGLKRGCDLACDRVYEAIPEAMQRGLVSEADIDRALRRTLATRFKLGMFDPPEAVPYASIPLEVVGSPQHRQLAYQAAVESVVLLKNRGGILPLSEDIRSLLVVGPTAASLEALLGNYYGLNPEMTTLLEGILAALPEGMRLEYRPGVQLVHPNLNASEGSAVEARNNDIVLACMGLTPMMEGEQGEAILSRQNGDRADLGLPTVQVEYLKKLAAEGTPIILVLTGGSPIALGEVERLVAAVVFVWYPGQEGGHALADVLFGRRPPSGKLPITFPMSVDQLPPFEDYSMEQRTYRYATWEPLYPFGFGLSYTRFEYSNLRLAREEIKAGEPLKVSLTLTNQGKVEAEEVVQFYLSSLQASVRVPQQSLVGCQRLRLSSGESRQVEFLIPPERMMFVDDGGRSQLEPGEFRLTVGGCSPGPRGIALGASKPVSSLFRVGG